MVKKPFQFSLKGMLWAIAWIGIGLATNPAFDAAHFLDDDGDNFRPRALAALWVALAVGAVGSLFGRPLSWGLIGLVVWIPVCLVLLLIVILPGLIQPFGERFVLALPPEPLLNARTCW